MFKSRLATLLLLLTAIFGVGVLLGFVLPRWLNAPSSLRVYSTPALLEQVKTISEFVTVQYVIEKIIVVEDVKWVAILGENRVLMVAHGTVKAGLDLGRVQPADLEVAGKTITLKLPPAEITEAYLDEKETRVVERSTGFLRTFDKNLEQTARQNALDEIRRAARDGGILKDAQERARVQLTHLFQQLGFEQVSFR
jgi:Protein of unknown function (DUF4230)